MESVLQTYWWFLFIFVVFKCLLDFNKPDTFEYRNYILFLFSTIFFIFLLSYNIAYTKQDFICGTQNTSLAFYATLFPYVFIYVLGMLFISVFPGWLRSFSNTFSGIFPGHVPQFIISQLAGAVLATLVFGWLFKKSESSSNE